MSFMFKPSQKVLNTEKKTANISYELNSLLTAAEHLKTLLARHDEYVTGIIPVSTRYIRHEWKKPTQIIDFVTDLMQRMRDTYKYLPIANFLVEEECIKELHKVYEHHANLAESDLRHANDEKKAEHAMLRRGETAFKDIAERWDDLKMFLWGYPEENERKLPQFAEDIRRFEAFFNGVETYLSREKHDLDELNEILSKKP